MDCRGTRANIKVCGTIILIWKSQLYTKYKGTKGVKIYVWFEWIFLLFKFIRDPPTRTTKHPLYTALILESFFWPWAMFCVYDANTSVFILGTFFWSAAAFYCRKKLENLPRTDKQTNKQTNKQTENSKTEATLSPVDCRGTRANSARWNTITIYITKYDLTFCGVFFLFEIRLEVKHTKGFQRSHKK